ncbi:carboxypeptidase [Thioclava sp. SK-1]|nr:carboxypeptidase [Thioclava sp. SK-1]
MTATNWQELAFDTDDIITGLKPWIECESPTYDAQAVGKMMDLVAVKCAELGATIEVIPGSQGLGPSVRARFAHPKMDQPGILISGHFDTVHPIGTLTKNPFRREGGKVYGPGIQDMKGGNYITLEAIRAIISAGIETPLPIVALFTPDEEIGTPATRTMIEAEAKRAKYVLCPEPAHADLGVCTGRYAIARFNLTATGKPSHAGANVKGGISAVRELARRIIEIEEMTSEECTFSCNAIASGQWVNCVPSFASAQCLSMAMKQEDLDAGVEKMLALNGTRNGVTFTVTRGVTRPVWEPGQPGTMALYEKARAISQSIGLDMPHASAGGGSDANFTGAMGIPSLCSLGVLGDGLHTLDEHIIEDMIVPRTRIIAGLLCTLE